ncbi:hypothetical protein N7508_009577 [Penicillium antarcticum]|nr:uncharacterized protein N7508_009577 [Penicillium antarcticum]KAJ5294756.1 hypothetical protein N7508_009577 [Penicillium antarcticum]
MPPLRPVRQRSNRACLACRQRKRKCDGKLPCSTCTGYGYDCDYDSTNSRNAVQGPSRSQAKPPASEPNLKGTSSVPSGILDSTKSRYVGRYSSVAFPLCVGLEMQAAKPPRLHSFGYHTGIRKEPDSTASLRIAKRMPWNTARTLLEYFFATIHPVFGFLDKDGFYERCETHWHGQPQTPDFEAIVCGVVALASLFNGSLDQGEEMWLILHAKEILEDPFVSRFPSIDQIAAWILRTIYLRATTRPHVAWICSCTTMHLVEATGLNQAPQLVMLTTNKGAQDSTPELSDILKRTARVAHSLHIVIAYEYGRSVMNLEFPSQEALPLSDRAGDFTPCLCSLVEAVPLTPMGTDSMATMQDLSSAINKLADTPASHNFLVLVRADLIFSIYRRLRLLEPNIRQILLDEVICAGMSALPAARALASQNLPWWNIISTVFQFVCVLLAIDTHASVTNLPDAMDTLGMIVDQLKTHLATEALATARNLVRASLDRRRKGVGILESIVGSTASDDAVEGPDSDLPQNLDFSTSFPYYQHPVDLDFLLNMDLLN